jgi:hypothetical protein
MDRVSICDRTRFRAVPNRDSGGSDDARQRRQSMHATRRGQATGCEAAVLARRGGDKV